jgi:hypothetical protein
VPTALVKVELVDTGAIAGTVTAFNAGDVGKYDDDTQTASSISLGTTASGFTCPTTEGTITATRLLDYQPTWAQSYSKQFPLEREPGLVTANNILRVRMTTATAINAHCFIVFEE